MPKSSRQIDSTQARRVLFFGTFDWERHPRAKVLAEGLRTNGYDVRLCNHPLDVGTSSRVGAVERPLRAIPVLAQLIGAWARLLIASFSEPTPELVVVGHLGHFDALVARLRWPRAIIALDYLISLQATALDRDIGSRMTRRLLGILDRCALRMSDIVLVDTSEHRKTLPTRHRRKSLVVPVGATYDWFVQQDRNDDSRNLRVIFYGMFTPLHGAEYIGLAAAALSDERIDFTMVGDGQDRSRTRDASGDAPNISWIDWVAPQDLPDLVAAHDVCLGIFGTTEKARRVVPNKVYQGAAAGCAIVTGETPPQRVAMGDAAAFVPLGDSMALAETLRQLAEDDVKLRQLQKRARQHAEGHFAPHTVVEPLELVMADPRGHRRGTRLNV